MKNKLYINNISVNINIGINDKSRNKKENKTEIHVPLIL